MQRKILTYWSAFSVLLILLLSSCCTTDDRIDEPIIEEKPRFLVDKIYNYDNELMADYFYNTNNQLIKRSSYDPINFPGIKIHDYELEYENNKVTLVKSINYTHPQFNHEIKIMYDVKGTMIADETYQFGNRISRRDYKYSNTGKIMSFINLNEIENYFMDYKNTNNILEVKILRKIKDDIANEEYREIYRNFIYDNNPKPNFGIGELFQFEPMPGFGEEAQIEKNISKNNLIEFINGTKWIYTYNENGFPATIDVKWKDIELEKPILYRIIYKEIVP